MPFVITCQVSSLEVDTVIKFLHSNSASFYVDYIDVDNGIPSTPITTSLTWMNEMSAQWSPMAEESLSVDWSVQESPGTDWSSSMSVQASSSVDSSPPSPSAPSAQESLSAQDSPPSPSAQESPSAPSAQESPSAPSAQESQPPPPAPEPLWVEFNPLVLDLAHCGICRKSIDDVDNVMLDCAHAFCGKCIRDAFNDAPTHSKRRCPFKWCRRRFYRRQIEHNPQA